MEELLEDALDLGHDEVETGRPVLQAHVDIDLSNFVDNIMRELRLFSSRSAFVRMACFHYAYKVIGGVVGGISEGLRNEAEALRRAVAATQRKLKARDFSTITKDTEALLLLLLAQGDIKGLLAQYHEQIATMNAVSPYYGEMYRGWLKKNPALKEVRAYVQKNG